MRLATQLLLLLLPAAQSHFHQSWEEGSLYGYKWYGQDWVKVVRDFYCDESCQHRLEESPTIDRMVRAARRGPNILCPLPFARTTAHDFLRALATRSSRPSSTSSTRRRAGRGRTPPAMCTGAPLRAWTSTWRRTAR